MEYKITIVFKEGKSLFIQSYNSDDKVRELLQRDLGSRREAWIRIGDYFISKNDILHINIEGDKVMERQKKRDL